MSRISFLPSSAASVALLLLVSGCGSRQSTGTGTPLEISGPPPAVVPDFVAHHHAHGQEGPHGGQLIEIGRNHAYHAELVIEKHSGLIDVYILDGDLKELGIDQEKIALSVLGHERPQTSELAAVELNGGKSSRFVAKDMQLAESLCQAKATGKLHVLIEGRPYIGYIEAYRSSRREDRRTSGY